MVKQLGKPIGRQSVYKLEGKHLGIPAIGLKPPAGALELGIIVSCDAQKIFDIWRLAKLPQKLKAGKNF